MSMPIEMITTNSEIRNAGFYWRSKDGVRALVCEALETAGFANGFSTRLGGVSNYPKDSLSLAGFDDDGESNIYENRRRFFALFDGEWRFAGGWQHHGKHVRHIQKPADADIERTTAAKCDALITKLPNILVGVKTADCVPVLLADQMTGAVAAVHAGWRGTAQCIVPHALKKMKATFGTHPADIIAAAGPAALGCCYEVGSEVIDEFRKQFPYADELLHATRERHARIDLHQANVRQLTDAGVPRENIYAAPLCTMCRNDLFFSYRRDRRLYGRTGRLLSVIGRRG